MAKEKKYDEVEKVVEKQLEKPVEKKEKSPLKVSLIKNGVTIVREPFEADKLVREKGWKYSKES